MKVKYSADELLKTKPTQLEGLSCTEEEKGNWNVTVNGMTIFAKSYVIVYGKSYAILRFLDSRGNIIATISVFGSSEYKQDEYFLVDFNTVISETCLRVTNFNASLYN